jgi:hypothetical protein
MWRRRRQPELVVPSVVVPVTQRGDVPDVGKIGNAVAQPPKPKRRRTRAEVANDAIVAEQAAAAEREKELAQVRQAARQEWEAGRRHLPPEPFNADGRYVF